MVSDIPALIWIPIIGAVFLTPVIIYIAIRGRP